MTAPMGDHEKPQPGPAQGEPDTSPEGCPCCHACRSFMDIVGWAHDLAVLAGLEELHIADTLTEMADHFRSPGHRGGSE